MHEKDTVTKGTHSELLATTALLANGWDVCEPVAPRRFDLVAKPPNAKHWVQIQVKTARERTDRNGEVVVYAKKNNGKPYTLDEAEYIIGIYNGEVYLIPNRSIGEYWVSPELINKKWQHLPLQY
jgi:hypothetical protein